MARQDAGCGGMSGPVLGVGFVILWHTSCDCSASPDKALKWARGRTEYGSLRVKSFNGLSCVTVIEEYPTGELRCRVCKVDSPTHSYSSSPSWSISLACGGGVAGGFAFLLLFFVAFASSGLNFRGRWSTWVLSLRRGRRIWPAKREGRVEFCTGCGPLVGRGH